MMFVETVHHPVETSRLGPTLMNEHGFILDSDVNHNYPERSWEGQASPDHRGGGDAPRRRRLGASTRSST